MHPSGNQARRLVGLHLGWAVEPFTVPGSFLPEDIKQDLKKWEPIQKRIR